MGRRRMVGVTVAAIALGGCGGSSSAGTPGGEAAGQIASGDEAEADGAGVAAAEEPQIEVGSSGELVVDGGALPDGFPTDLPLPEGLVLDGAVPTGPGTFDLFGSVDPGSVSAVLDRLVPELERDGWTTELLEAAGEAVGVRATHGEQRYELQLTDLGDGPVLVMLHLRLAP